MPDQAPLVRADDISVRFISRRSLFGRPREVVQALTGVTIEIARGESLGLVGESGSGKSTLARAILRLVEPSAGKVTFDASDITHQSGSRLKAYRRRVGVVFQSPYSSLNPAWKVEDLIAEPLRVHRLASGTELRERVVQVLEQVGLDRSHLRRLSSSFSGGQQQRLAIGRAIATRPDLLVCDEAVSALDASTRAQVLNLLVRLQRELDLAILFISHDLAVVRAVTSRIAVMYLGRLVEQGPSAEVVERPLHPYTAALTSASPSLTMKSGMPRILLEGDIPSPIALPKGCSFAGRCPLAMQVCRSETPRLRRFGSRQVACHLHEEGSESRGHSVASLMQKSIRLR